jgi:DNA-binding MarR family transcriptional regulator
VSNTKDMTLRLLEHTAGLPANQRLILMLYAAHPTDRAGTVSKTAAELADVLGMSPTVFSRTRRQIVESGWLEESERLGHIRYYRLSPKATGEEVVVPLRRAT